MTKEEIINTPELVDFMLDESVIADSREKLRKRLEEICNLAIKALEQEPCEDCISRKELDKALYEHFHEEDSPNNITDVHLGTVRNFIKNFPPVKPQPKTGKWIMIDKELQRYKCSECGEVIRLYKKSEIPKLEKDETLSNYPFSHCGCRMVESQESEE